MDDEIRFDQKDLPSIEPGGADRVLVHRQDAPGCAVLLTPLPQGWMIEAGGDIRFADCKSDAVVEAHAWIRRAARPGSPVS